jgi:hypothetical protein
MVQLCGGGAHEAGHGACLSGSTTSDRRTIYSLCVCRDNFFLPFIMEAVGLLIIQWPILFS